MLFETVRLRPAFGVPMTNLKCAVIRLLSIHACGFAVALTLEEGSDMAQNSQSLILAWAQAPGGRLILRYSKRLFLQMELG